MNATVLSDKDLVRQILEGRPEAFSTLVERYLHSALAIARARLVNPADADDAVQEAFLRAYQGLRSLRDPAKFGPWLLTITRNEAVRLVAKGRSTLGADPAATPDAAAAESNPAQQELHALLRQHIGNMPEPAREVLLLHYFAGRSTREIAELLDLRQSAVLKRLQRAREHLAETLLRDLEATRPSEASFTKHVARIVALASAVSVGSAVTSTAAVSAAASLLFPKAATIAAGAIGAAITLAGIAGFVQQARDQPTYAQRDQAPTGETGESDSRRPSPNATTPESQESPSPARAEESPSRQVSSRTVVAQGEPPRSTVAGPERVDLDQKVTLAFEDVHLAEILSFLAEETSIEFLVDRGAVGVPGKAETEPAPPVMRPFSTDGMIKKVHVQNQALYDALDGILADAGLKLVLAPGYLWISTPAQIRRDGRSYSHARYANYPAMNSIGQKPANLQFDNVHVSEVVLFVNDIYDVNIAIDNRVVAHPGKPSEVPVFTAPKCTDGRILYINLKGIRLEDALQLLTRLTNMTVAVREGYVWLTSEQMIRRHGIMPLLPENRDERLNKVLASPITVAFEDVTLYDILRFINEIYEINIPVDQRVVAWNGEPSVGVPVVGIEKSVGSVSHGVICHINVRNILLSSALDVLTRDLDLAYEIRGNAVVMSNTKRLLASGLDASDLVSASAFLDLTKEAMHKRDADVAQIDSAAKELSQAGGEPEQSKEPPRVIEIRRAQNGYRANIDTGQRTAWYAEGESFEAYTLMRIDANKGCVELFNGASNTNREVCKEERPPA